MTANDILEQLTLCLHGIIQKSDVQPELEALLNKANQLPQFPGPDAFVCPTDLVGFNDVINKISQLPPPPELKGGPLAVGDDRKSGECQERDWFDQIYYNGAYIITARIIYRITKPLPELSAAEQTILDTLQRKQYYIGETPHTDIANKKLSSLFKTLSEEGKREWTDKASTIRQNYTFNHGDPLTNQTFVESLDDHHLSDVRDLFDSCFDKILTHYFRSHYGICNIRTYQFTPITKKTDSNIHIHCDGLAKDSIKSMFFDGLITEDLGCLRILNYNNHVLLDSITGLNPFLLFNPTITKHEAFAPTAGRRSTIEITMMPTLTNELPVVDGGCKAGGPINPFKSWSKKLVWPSVSPTI